MIANYPVENSSKNIKLSTGFLNPQSLHSSCIGYLFNKSTGPTAITTILFLLIS